MAAGTYDFAILGASPFALLLAGLLRSAHGKSVVVVADPWSDYRLARGFELSVMPATRPETWALLKRGATETTRLLGTVGKNLYERVDPLSGSASPPSGRSIAVTPPTPPYAESVTL
jgi:hypothetical protein